MVGFTADGVILLGQPLVDFGYPYTYVLDVADTGRLRRVFSWHGALYVHAQSSRSDVLATLVTGPGLSTIPALVDLEAGSVHTLVWPPTPPDVAEPGQSHPVYMAR